MRHTPRFHWAPQCRTPRGMVLITSYFAISIMLVLQGAVMSRMTHDIKLSHRETQSLQALHYAEAGLDHAMVALRSNAAYTGTNGPIPLGIGAYNTTVQQFPLHINMRRVIVTGVSGDATRPVYAIVRLFDDLFHMPIFGDRRVTVDGNVTLDMYNSTNGTYEDEHEPANERASLGTNATATSSMTVTGTVDLNDANLYCGPGGDPETAIYTGSNTTYGEKGALEYSHPFPAIVVPPLPNNYVVEPMILSGTVIRILDPSHPKVFPTTGGNYAVVVSKLKVTEYAKLLVPQVGPRIDLFVIQNDLFFSDEAVVGDASGERASLLTIAVRDNQARITGNAVFYGALYVPNHELSVGGTSQVFGALVADDVEVGGAAALHFDLGLAESPGMRFRRTELYEWHAGTEDNE